MIHYACALALKLIQPELGHLAKYTPEPTLRGTVSVGNMAAPERCAVGRIILAIQAFFAVLFRGVVPVAALPAPESLPQGYLAKSGPSPEVAAQVEAAEAASAAAKAALEAAEAKARASEETLASERASAQTAQTQAADQAADQAKALKAAQTALQSSEAASKAANEQAAALEERVGVLTGERDEARGKLGGAREDGALSLLAWLQREGRLIDFLREDIDGYDDEQIGAAVRAIHKGCRKVIDEALELEHILQGEEESPVTIPAGFDPVTISLSGKVAGEPPFKGTLMHHGWRTSAVKIPVSETVDTRVLAAAEVEL